MNIYIKSHKFSSAVHPHLRRIGKSVASCSNESSQYSLCCTTRNLNITQYDCNKEFEKLILCVRNKMKVMK